MGETPERQWHYAIRNERIGPVPESALVKMVAAAQIGGATLVWTDGMPEWKTLGTFPELVAHAPAHKPFESDAAMRMLLPIGRSPWAIGAGYLGLISLFPIVGFAAGPAAIICAIIAIREIRRDPTRHGMGRAVTGIVLGSISIGISLIVLVALLSGR